jgi:nitrous oxidase accessory protein NosD
MIKPIMNYEPEIIDGVETGYGLTVIESSTISENIVAYGMPIFKYNINSIYNLSKSNNFIECIVSKENITYRAIKELTFG